MFAKFFPQETCFWDFFNRHTEFIILGAQEFDRLAKEGGLFKESDALKFKNWEHQADRVAHECLEVLHQTFITPIEREDIFLLTTSLDDIMDNIAETFDRAQVYRIDTSQTELQQMVHMLLEAALAVHALVTNLRHLEHRNKLRDYCKEIVHIEHAGDAALRAALITLFENETDTHRLIKLKEIYERLEDAIDSCHKIANIVEGIVVKNV